MCLYPYAPKSPRTICPGQFLLLFVSNMMGARTTYWTVLWVTGMHSQDQHLKPMECQCWAAQGRSLGLNRPWTTTSWVIILLMQALQILLTVLTKSGLLFSCSIIGILKKTNKCVCGIFLCSLLIPFWALQHSDRSQALEPGWLLTPGPQTQVGVPLWCHPWPSLVCLGSKAHHSLKWCIGAWSSLRKCKPVSASLTLRLIPRPVSKGIPDGFIVSF